MRPQWQDSPDRRAELLESVGFVLRRETSRFEWRSESGLPAVARRLDFRGLDAVGEEAFVGAIERVSEGTLDHEIQDERDEFGPAEAARRFFELEGKLEYDPAWCRLAYAPDGGLVGLGDASEERHLRGDQLYRRRAGAQGQRIRGRPARGRHRHPARRRGRACPGGHRHPKPLPMAAAFGRAGYAEFAQRREYGVKLAPQGAKVG
jgi:hypothetical protein